MAHTQFKANQPYYKCFTTVANNFSSGAQTDDFRPCSGYAKLVQATPKGRHLVEHAGSRSSYRPVTPDGSCRPSVEHAGSRSPRALSVFCALHGRWHYAVLLFRSALESFVSARRWTHERVSAAGGRRDFGYTGVALDPGSEASRGRG